MISASRALFFSLLLHGLLLVFCFSFRSSPRTPEVFYVDLPEIPARATTGGGKGGAKPGRGSARKAKALPRGWTWRSGSTRNSGAASPSSSGQQASGFQGRGGAVEGYAANMDLAAEGKFFSFAQRLHRRVGSHLGYPADFVEENIAGDVTLHFLVDGSGRFLRFLETEADQELLRIYTMAMVALALRDPLEGVGGRREEAAIPVAMKVHFRLLLPDEYAVRENLSSFKNHLQFERFAFTDPPATKAMRRLMEKYLPPVIPIPGGVFVDFVALYKRIKESESDDQEWRRKNRMQLQKEELEVFFKKGAAG